MRADDVRKDLHAHADEERAQKSKRFFKTGPGTYGEGDRFIGVRVPQLRKLAKAYRALPLTEAERLLASPIHEERHIALFILVEKYRREKDQRQRIVEFYLAHRRQVNNWDLVDCSAPDILGAFLLDKELTPLRELAHADSLWDRRIAMLATKHHIRHGRFDSALEIAEILVHDTEDLIQKAVGWMIRELAESDMNRASAVLDEYAATMPRPMVRYAHEKYPAERRAHYMTLGKA